MKKGDKVVINEGSYSRIIRGNELTYGPGGDELTSRPGPRKQYIIVETGCSFPNTGSYSGSFNNTVIQAIDSGKVVFIEERFLKLIAPKHRVMVDMTFYRAGGQIVEISDKLYKEIKKS